ncbi:MAG: hypothetical protein KIH62_003890 [Candidatus Kerfeldbacteria bacterium]|nr:hypothetical protein [Candidatus Kerfeldbacteria bacterium]
MILARRILPFFAPLVFALVFVGLLTSVHLLWWWVAMLCLSACICSAFLLQWKIFTARFFWITMPLLVLLLTSAGVMVMVPSASIRIAYACVAVVMAGVYIEDVFILFFQAHKYTQLSLPQFCIFLNVWSAYGLGLVMFTVLLLHLAPLWVLLLSAGVFGLYIGGHVLWSFALWKKTLWVIPLISVALVVECTWVLTLLPFSFIVSAFLLCILVYILLTFIQLIYRNAFTFDTVMRPTVIALVGSIAILLTTRWFY